jgi:hypothetical protein
MTEIVAALRQQMAALEEHVAAINQQQASLRASLNHLLAHLAEPGPTAETGATTGQPQLRSCADDVVRVLREVGRPLGTLEILEEMANRHLSWRESTVRHALADLKSDGIVREGDGQRAMSYSLAHP